LAAIVGYSETLLRGALEDPETSREFVETIHRNAAWLRRLVEDLLDLAALEAGKTRVEPQAVAVRDAVAAAFEAVAERASARRVTLTLGSGLDLAVHSDPGHLRRMVLNALDNAVKHGREGGAASVSASATHDRVSIAVSDDGPGLSPDELERVFERFHRAQGAIDRGIKGSGLGLAMIRSLAAANGGAARLESEPGRGSTMIVTLPRAPAGA
jgi:two-component system phosphate regulon sensor histidine kinase PhoR